VSAANFFQRLLPSRLTALRESWLWKSKFSAVWRVYWRRVKTLSGPSDADRSVDIPRLTALQKD